MEVLWPYELICFFPMSGLFEQLNAMYDCESIISMDKHIDRFMKNELLKNIKGNKRI